MRVEALFMITGRHSHEGQKSRFQALQGDPGGLPDRVPGADDARRLHQARGQRHIHAVSDHQAHHLEDRKHHPRGDEPHRRPGGAVPGDHARRSVAQVRAVRRHRLRASAVQGPLRRGHGAGHDPRGGVRPADDRRGRLLHPVPVHDLPDPDQVPRRAPLPRRPDPRARVHHEGRLLLPHRWPPTAA